MATCTPIYRLPVIEGTDDPCDQSDTWCAFATAVEAELDRLDAVVDRTVDTIPMAQVRLTIPRLQAPNPGGGTPQFVPFDTIDVDTADMVDLTADPFTITLPRFGLYRVHLYVEGTTAGAGNEWRVSARTASGSSQPSSASQTYLDDGSTPVLISSCGMYAYQSPVPPGSGSYTTSESRLVLKVDAAAVSLPLTAATLGVRWMRDLP